uniref:Uncharacterized protein n=1 Tax=Rhizophora mucronata TaxID=61149 RepID=A0A2P2NV68_RHIMU
MLCNCFGTCALNDHGPNEAITVFYSNVQDGIITLCCYTIYCWVLGVLFNSFPLLVFSRELQ